MLFKTLQQILLWEEKIQPIQGTLDKVMKITGVSFDRKENGKQDIGMLAEEVGEIIPVVVE